MMRYEHVLRLCAAALLTLPLTACRDDDGPVEAVATVSNIVTYDGSTQGRSLFSFIKSGDGPVVMLTSRYDASALPEGQRCLISYLPPEGDESRSGEIDLRSLSRITTAPIQTGDIADYPGWNATPVYLLSLWRSGRYVNLHCRLPYNSNPRMFALLADEATIGDDVPQLYLMHDTPAGDTYQKVYYASFDISELVELNPDASSVEIHLNNSNLDKSVFSVSLPSKDTM